MPGIDDTSPTQPPKSPKSLPPPPVVIDQTQAALQHPLTSLIILAPLCLIGEVLRLTAGSSPASRELLADPLLVELGHLVGLHLPFVTLAALILWWLIVQLGGRYPWRLPPLQTFGLVIGWGIIWAICRLAVGFTSEHTLPDTIAGTTGLLVSGAIQEELLFRGIVLGGLLALIRCFDWPAATAIWVFLPLSAIFFSLAHTTVVNHHTGAELFVWKPFIERALAGAIYGYAFLRQGLAVAVLAHLGYLLALEAGVRF